MIVTSATKKINRMMRSRELREAGGYLRRATSETVVRESLSEEVVFKLTLEG